jgi:flagellin
LRSIGQATRNTNDGISLVEVAEGAFHEINNIVVRLRELGVQAASDTIGDVERGMVNKEVQQLKQEIDRIAKVTTWTSTKLLDGTSPKFDLQVGIFADPKENIISFDPAENNVRLSALGLEDVDYSTKQGAQEGLGTVDKAIDHINGCRSNLGAIQNRLVSTLNNLGVQNENISAANSRIRDTDVAQATADVTRNNILLQAGTSTLVQANQVSSLALKLIG